jgi:hypothetical protein
MNSYLINLIKPLTARLSRTIRDKHYKYCLVKSWQRAEYLETINKM